MKSPFNFNVAKDKSPLSQEQLLEFLEKNPDVIHWSNNLVCLFFFVLISYYFEFILIIVNIIESKKDFFKFL